MTFENNKLFGKQNNFSSQKHIEKDFSTYSAKILLKSLEEELK